MSASCNTFSEHPNSHYKPIASFCTLGLLVFAVKIFFPVLWNVWFMYILVSINFSNTFQAMYVSNGITSCRYTFSQKKTG